MRVKPVPGDYVRGLYKGKWHRGWLVGEHGLNFEYKNLIEIDQATQNKGSLNPLRLFPGYKKVQSHLDRDDLYWWVASVYPARPHKIPGYSYAISSTKVKDGIKVGDKWITQKQAPKRANVKKT